MSRLKNRINSKRIVLLLIGIVILCFTLMTNDDVNALEKYRELPINQYGTITYERAKILDTLDGQSKDLTNAQLNRTYFITSSYTRGIAVYYLFENQEGDEIGYISASSMTLTGDRPEGVMQPLIQDEKIFSDEYPLLNSFFQEDDKSSTDLVHDDVQVRGAYHHFNGSIYYKINDVEGKILGLMDSRAMKELPSASSNSISGQTKQLDDGNSSEVSEVKARSSEITKQDVLVEDEKNHETQTAEPLSNFSGNPYFISGIMNIGSTRVQRALAEEQVTIQTPQVFKESLFSSKQEFIDLLAKEAQVLGEKYNLYPSVMIAQAVLESAYGESLLTKEANNFFGMKFTVGVDEGLYERYDIYSDEYLNGQWVSLPASFRKYPTIKDSLEDYAKKLAQGVSWDAYFYQGTWRSVAKSYQEATQALTGKYATDPQYHQKLNAIISNWNLSQFD